MRGVETNDKNSGEPLGIKDLLKENSVISHLITLLREHLDIV